MWRGLRGYRWRLFPMSSIGAPSLSARPRASGSLPQCTPLATRREGGVERAPRLLIETGYRRIALVNGLTRISTARERLRGYRAAIEEAGLTYDEKYVRLGPFTFEHGRQSTLDLLALTPRPDAIFSSSVILTTGVLWSLRARRVRWPEDIAVVGFPR